MNGPCMGDSHLLVSILQDYFGGKRDKLVGAEVGTHRGETAALLLRSFPQLFLYMVDPWATYLRGDPYRASGDACSRFSFEQQEKNKDAAFEATHQFADRRMICRGGTEKASFVSGDISAKGCLGLDFVFIDGAHHYEAVKRDLQFWTPLVRPGGLVSGHDFSHPRNARGFWGVDRAVREHFDSFAVKGSVWWTVKL